MRPTNDSGTVPDQGDERQLRSLLALVGAVVLLDMLFYTALAPLLPRYAEELELSKSQTGVLQASYAAGIFVFALPCGWLAARVGVRRVMVCGLLLLALASLLFGFARSLVVLDGSRVLQGASAACSWAGALAWLVAAAPAHRRGALVGSALGVSLVGALGGPALGALIELTGPEPAFTTVAVAALALAGATRRVPAPRAIPIPEPRALARSVNDRALATAFALLALFGVAGAVIGTLVTLQLDALGAGAGAISATFLTAAAVEAGVNPLLGRRGDQTADRLAPVRRALPVAAGGLLLLAISHHVLAIVSLTVLTVGAVGVIFTPVSTLLGDRAEARGIPLAIAYALMNLAWAAGSVIGGSGGGALAQATGDAVVYGVVAALALVSVIGTTLGRPATCAWR